MSLINQMLKDLEQRGAGVNDVEKMIPSSLNAAKNPAVATQHVPLHYHSKHGVPYLKISGLMILLTGGTYLWMQSAPALSQSIEHLKALSFINKPQATLTEAKSLPNPIVQNQPVSNEQISTSKPASQFEYTLKYTPIASEIQTIKFEPFVEKKLDKSHEKPTVLANVMPAELLANNHANLNQSTKAIELAKPTESSDATSFQAKSDIIVVAKKSSLHSNANNNGVGKQISEEQKSGNAYRQALANLQQGRVAEAQSSLMQALEANPANQEARQTLAGLLLDNNRNDEARTIMAAGLAISPEQTNFRIALARLQVELGDKSGALNTLEQGLAYANDNADYQSFLATLLQRADRHDEAISHYNKAISINSGAANSLIGLGISLKATGKLENAQEAFTRAQSVASLSPELAQFIDQQLKQINQHLQSSTSK
jgi:MSHA biogenesis protein MshN